MIVLRLFFPFLFFVFRSGLRESEKNWSNAMARELLRLRKPSFVWMDGVSLLFSMYLRESVRPFAVKRATICKCTENWPTARYARKIWNARWGELRKRDNPILYFRAFLEMPGLFCVRAYERYGIDRACVRRTKLNFRPTLMTNRIAVIIDFYGLSRNKRVQLYFFLVNSFLSFGGIN